MNISRYSQFVTALTYIIILIHLYLSVDFYSLLFLNALQICRMLSYKLRGTLNILGLVCFTFLFLAPSLALSVFQDRNTFWIVALFIVFFDALKLLGARSERSKLAFSFNTVNPGHYIKYVLISLSLAALLGFIVPSGLLANFVAFVLPYCAGIYYFEMMLKRQPSMRSLIAVLIGFFFVFLTFLAFYWSGYGRLNAGVVLILPFSLAFIYRDIGIRAWHVVLIAPFALMAAAFSRYGEIPIEKIFIGSAGHHLMITDDFLQNAPGWYKTDVAGFVDQVKLLFFNWFPRDLWHNKPLGVGFTSVDDWFGREGFAAHFTVSVGMFGETIYYLGEYFLLGNAIIVALIFIIRTVVRRLSRGFQSPTVIFDINLLSYVWGGSAVFGSRVWFYLIPTLLLCMYLDRIRVFPKKRNAGTTYES